MTQIDAIEKVTGAFGTYQLILCLFIFASKFFVAFHCMGIIFLAPKVSYKCPERETCPCQEPIYDTSIFTRTIIMEWNMICERKWLTSFTQAFFQFGVLIGSIVFGMASDRFGRKKPLLVTVVFQFIAGVGAAFAPEYWSFTFIRFVLGMSVGGLMVTSFIVIMEFAGAQNRDILSALYQVPFNLGHMLLPLISYFLRDFSHFQLAISVPAVLLLSYFVVIPETPRWLIAMERDDEAIRILERVAKINKRPTENIRADINAYQASLEHQLKKGTILDLFRTPNLRKNTIVMSMNWLACGYCFYGVSQYMGQLSGDIFINVLACGSVSLVGVLTSIVLMRFVGRKLIVIAFHFICAGCLILLAIIPAGAGSVMLACLGVVFSLTVFVVSYLYCSELFPTVVRNAALGFSSMSARIGSMLAPFVIDLGGVAEWLPPILFASLPLIAGCVLFLIPETKGCALMNTIEEGERFGKKS